MELELIFWNPILSTKLGSRTNGVGTDGARLSLPNLDTNRRCWSVLFGTGFSLHQNLGDEPMELECIFWKRIPTRPKPGDTDGLGTRPKPGDTDGLGTDFGNRIPATTKTSVFY